MAAVQREEYIPNWSHFEEESRLHIQMETKFLPHFTILFAAIILAWYFETFDFGFFKYTSKKKGDAVDELLKKKHQVIGKECIPNTNTCFLIVDSYYLENGRLTTKRDLLLEENTEYSLTGVEIESTKPVSWENLDSRDWAVNKVVINSRYARLLVASGFIMESLTFDENDHHDVLIAGLGGGVMSNFLSEISYLNIDTTVVEKEEFIINIAENYFGHAETNEMRVVHSDVLEFLQKYDKKYDVIIVDACENKRSNVVCPVSEVLKKESVQLLKKRLTLNGCLAVNVYITQDVVKNEKEILELFSKEFTSCFFLEYFKDKKGLGKVIQIVREHVGPGPVIVIHIPQTTTQNKSEQIEAGMLNQQHNQGAQQLLNVQRPHQIQPPGQHRQGQMQQQSQNQMQQGQHVNMGQQQMPQQRSVIQQPGPSNSQQVQSQQGQMMNMGQQNRSQMMQNSQHQQQIRGNPQQMRQGQQMQSQQQQPQMSQMRMQQNQQNMNVPQQRIQNMQQNNQQGMRMPQNQQQQRMQPQQQQHQQLQQQGGSQNMGRPSPQPIQMQQGGQQNINRPPSQQMQQTASQGMNRASPQLNNMPHLHQIMSRPPVQLPPTSSFQQQPRVQQMQQNQQNMNSGSPQQHQMHQGQQSGPQQQMRIQQTQQQQDQQMQQGQATMNGPPQQQSVRVAQVFPVQAKPNVQRSSQVIRGPMQNSPQNAQMRMGQQAQQNQGQALQPIRPNTMGQQRQIAQNQQRQQLQQQGSMPHQQNSQQRINQPQPINHPQSMKQDIQQNIQTVAFEPDNGQTIRINGEHAIINGMQYKLVPQNQETQQGHSQQNQQNPPAQQMQHMQQRGQNNQVPNQQQQQQQQPAQQQQQQQQQQNLQNQQITPNQNNRQNQQMQSNMRNQQTPPVPQQNAPGKSKPRSRTKKPPVPEPMPTQTVTPEKAANQQMPTSSSNLQTTPSTSGSIPAKRRIMPPSLTPLKTDTTPPGQNSSRSGSHPPQQRMVQQGKNMVQVGGAPPNRQLTTPQKANPRQQQPKQGVLGNQKPNGRVQSGGPARTSQPSTSRRRTNENKENMIEIRDAILSHVRGTRKMTAEYTNYVQEELSRVLKELEKLELTHDSRYISVKRLLALVKGEDPKKIETPEKAPKPPQKEPIEVIELEEEEPKEETKEERQSRYDGYMKFLKDSYPETSWNVNFPFIDETTIKNEAVLYREQDMKEREAYLRKIVDTLPEEEQTKTKIEYLGLSLLDFQTELRKQIMETTVLVPPTEFLINPWSIRRTKQEYALELKQHPDRAALEKKRKSSNYAFLQSVIKHSREFKEFHKRNLANHTKVRKSMQQYITNEAKRVAREEMKNEKIRIQKLIQEDEEGYRAMLDDKKDRRLVYLLEQTDDYIKSLCDLLKQQQNSTSGSTPVKKTPRKEYDGLAEEEKVKSILDKARNDEDEYENKAKMNIEDYYTTAHGVREEIMQQHTMMGGGNASLKLKPYQLKGLEWMVSLYNNNLNGILADEMGLGKTIQTIAFITYLIQVKKSSGPFLVIVPLSTVPNWKNEFDKWAPNVHLIVYKGNKDARKLNEPIIKTGKFNVLLTTFEYVIREKALLGKLRWKYMMIDEGHRLKNQHCKLTDMLNTRFQCQRRLLITGTPLQNKLPELWALLNFLLPSIFSSCSTFEQWFNAPFATTGEKVELTSEETMLIIRRLHKVLRPFLLRRLKKEVESELPDKMEFVIKCEMSGLQKVLYKHMQKGLLLDGKTTSGSRSLMNTMVHLRKLCNHPFLFQNVEESCRCFWETKQITAMDLFRVSGKLELLDRILPKLKATGHRVLMFFQMTAMMTVVEDYLAGTTINYLRLDGSTKPDDRGLLLDKFNAPNSKYFLFMLSTRAGGLGLNLQTADTVIIFDSDWNPHQDMQAQDRAHRIGQKAEVRVFRLITANSVEEKILAAARFKLNVDEKVIQAGKFDNRSTGAERRQILENIIKAENENDEDEEVPNDEAINDILSRSEEEFDLFQKMDQERFAHEKRINAKPRLCGDDEIPKDILRAADETEYIEKAKEEGVIPYLEVMPGSKRARKEVDYSTDTMSDDKFLEKLFDGEDVTPTKSDPKPDAVSEPKVTPKAIPRPEPVKETPKAAIPATPSPVEPPHPKIPPLTFKVPRLIVKFGSGLKRKPETSESDSVTPPKAPKLPEVESKKEDDNILKRKDPPLGKIRIKFGGEPLEKYTRIETDNTPKKLLDEKHRKEEKSEKHQSGDDSTPKKKKKHRERDEEGSSERKKKHKHKHHRQEEESPSKSHHKHDKESPLKSHHKNDKGSSSSSLDTDASSKTVPKVINDSPLTQVSQPSTSSSEPSKPPLKLKLTFKFPPLPPSTPVNGSDPKKDSETKTDSTPKKDTTPKVDSEPKTSSSEKKAHGEHKKHKEHKEHKEKKHSKEHKEHKKKSREGETEEERRARKEAKRLKRQSGDQEDDAKRQEKLARKAARKEQKRLDKEKEKLETSSGSLPENAAGTA